MNVNKFIEMLNQFEPNLEVVYINDDCDNGSEVIIGDENINPSQPNHDMILLKGF